MLFWGSFGQKFHSVWFFKFHEKSAVESFCFAGSYRNISFTMALNHIFGKNVSDFQAKRDQNELKIRFSSFKKNGTHIFHDLHDFHFCIKLQ